MANVTSIKGPDDVRVSEREKLIRYNVKLSGNYVQHVRGANTGEVIDLTKATGLSAGASSGAQFWGQKGPRSVYVTNIGESGYAVSIIPGADSLHWLLVIYSSLATELVAGAYPAGLLADNDLTIEAAGRSFD